MRLNQTDHPTIVTTREQPDHIDDDLLDGCGLDGNVLVLANEVGGVAERCSGLGLGLHSQEERQRLIKLAKSPYQS